MAMTKQEYETKINEAITSIEKLVKSATLAKDEPIDKDKLADQVPPPPPPAADAANPGAPAGDMPPPPPTGGDVPPPPSAEEPPPPPGDETKEPLEEEFDPGSLSDEELDAMLSMLQSEKEKRGAAKPEDKLEMSMKKEFSALAKSLKDEVASLRKELTTVKTPVKNEVPVTRPAAVNTADVKPLEKSAPVATRLSKQATMEAILDEQRKGSKLAKSEHVAYVNACKTQEQLNFAQDELVKAGVLPKA